MEGYVESISPYHLAQHEDGTWHVIDAVTGGPAEISAHGRIYMLWKLPREEAEAWSRLLNGLPAIDRPGAG